RNTHKHIVSRLFTVRRRAGAQHFADLGAIDQTLQLYRLHEAGHHVFVDLPRVGGEGDIRDLDVLDTRPTVPGRSITRWRCGQHSVSHEANPFVAVRGRHGVGT